MTCRVSTLCVWELNPSRRTIFCNTLREEISHTHKQHLQGWGGNLNFQQSYRADLSWRARSPKKPAAPRRRPPQSQKWSNGIRRARLSCAITRRRTADGLLGNSIHCHFQPLERAESFAALCNAHLVMHIPPPQIPPQ